MPLMCSGGLDRFVTGTELMICVGRCLTRPKVLSLHFHRAKIFLWQPRLGGWSWSGLLLRSAF